MQEHKSFLIRDLLGDVLSERVHGKCGVLILISSWRAVRAFRTFFESTTIAVNPRKRKPNEYRVRPPRGTGTPARKFVNRSLDSFARCVRKKSEYLSVARAVAWPVNGILVTGYPVERLYYF